jgi:hypothetical protein
MKCIGWLFGGVVFNPLKMLKFTHVCAVTGMRGRHWDAISKVVGARIWPGEELQLTRVIKAGVLNHMEALQVRQTIKVSSCLFRAA